MQQCVDMRLNTEPACVIRSVRPDRRSSGVPTSASRRARARETPDCVTDSSSLTSVTVVPSATCWNQRSASGDLTDLDAILARYSEEETADIRGVLAARR